LPLYKVNKKYSMNQETYTLPDEFDGVFRFTNFTDEDFTTLWNGKEYTFPKQSTSPMIISGESLENIQNIRKLFAKRLAKREFYNGSRYEELNGLTQKSGGIPPLFNEDKEFEGFIQKCLEPLPVARVTVKEKKKEQISVSEYTKVVGDKESLKANANDMGSQLDSLPE